MDKKQLCGKDRVEDETEKVSYYQIIEQCLKNQVNLKEKMNLC